MSSKTVTWLKQHGVSLLAVLVTLAMVWSTQIGAEAKLMQRVETLESGLKHQIRKTDKVVKIESELTQIRRDINTLIVTQEKFNGLSNKMLLLERKEDTNEENVGKLTDYTLSLSDKIIEVEKNQAVGTEILSRLNDTLSKLDTTMDENLKHINNSIGEVKGQVGSIEVRLKGVEKKLGDK
tara:strand:- start:38250 stop:38792 length:543 start_codon:yes stop_codon:yes gene_type:complete